MANQKQGGSYGSGQGGQGSYGGSPMQGMQGMQGGQPMMYPYYQNQMGMGQMPQQPGGQSGQQLPPSQNGGNLPLEEESYIENILRLNKGKQATVYMTFENNDNWNAKIFKGIIEAAGRDHIILSDPETGLRYLLLMVYLDYITFPEEINYAYPFGGNPNNRPR